VLQLIGESIGVVLGLEGVAGHIPDASRRGDFGYCGRATVVQNLSAVTAACLVMPKLVFDEIGGFNERDLTVAYSDVDLCLRICEAGYNRGHAREYGPTVSACRQLPLSNARPAP